MVPFCNRANTGPVHLFLKESTGPIYKFLKVHNFYMIVIVIVITDVMGLEEDNRGSYSWPVCY